MLHTGGKHGRDTRAVQIRPVLEGMDEPLPMEVEQEHVLRAPREGRRDRSTTRREGVMGGHRGRHDGLSVFVV